MLVWYLLSMIAKEKYPDVRCKSRRNASTAEVRAGRPGPQLIIYDISCHFDGIATASCRIDAFDNA
jgi:hypothetical protein